MAVSGKRCEIGPRLLLITNKKWHTPIPDEIEITDLG